MRRSLPKATNKTGRADREKPHKENQTNTRRGQTKQKGGEPTTPKRTEGSEAGSDTQRANRDAGGRKQAEASSSRRERAPGKAAGTGGRKQHRPRRRARAALTVGSGSPKGEYLSAGARGTKQHLQHGVGRSLTQGRSLCCGEVKRSQSVTTHHTTGTTTGPLQIPPDIRRLSHSSSWKSRAE